MFALEASALRHMPVVVACRTLELVRLARLGCPYLRCLHLDSTLASTRISKEYAQVCVTVAIDSARTQLEYGVGQLIVHVRTRRLKLVVLLA